MESGPGKGGTLAHRDLDPAAGQETGPWRTLLPGAIGAGHFLVLFNTGAFLPMIPQVAGSLGVNPAYVDWTQDGFFWAMAFAFPLAPWYAGLLGERRGLILAFAGFAAASALAAGTGGYGWFLAARIVQGLAGGLTMPLSLAAILRHDAPGRKNLGLVLWGVASVAPFSLGPVVGGWITDFPGWRWLFRLNVPVALGVVLFLALLLRDSGRTPGVSARPRLDVPGFLLLVLGVGAWQSAFNLGGLRDWLHSPWVTALLVGGTVCLLYFAVWSWNRPASLLPLDLLRRRNFTVAALGLFLAALWFQGTLALYVVQFQLAFGYTAFLVGLTLLPMAVLSKAGSMLTHSLLQRLDPRFVGVFALLGFAAGSFWISSYNRPASPEALLWPPLLLGAFLGTLFPPFVTLGLAGLEPPLAMRGAAFLNFLRSTGQAMGIPLVAALWERRNVLHRHFLVEDGAQAAAQFDLARKGLERHTGLTPAAARLFLARSVAHHAALLSFNEVFWCAGWVFAVLGVLLLLARPRKAAAVQDARVRLSMEELVEP